MPPIGAASARVDDSGRASSEARQRERVSFKPRAGCAVR